MSYSNLSSFLLRRAGLGPLSGTARPMWPQPMPLSSFQAIDKALGAADTLRSAQARDIHQGVFNAMLQTFNERNPNLRRYTSNMNYEPGYFVGLGEMSPLFGTSPRKFGAVTGGWVDIPGRQPTTKFNFTAFKSAAHFGLVLGHEIGHRVQVENPNIYRGEACYEVMPGDSLSAISWKYTNQSNQWHELFNLNRNIIGENPHLIHPGQRLKLPSHWRARDDGWVFREFDATLTDLEGRYRNGMPQVSAIDKLSRLQTGNTYFQYLMSGDPHWSRLSGNPATRMIPEDRTNRWTTVRDKTWRELRWHDMPGVLDLPQFRQFTQPASKPWNLPFGVG